MHLAKNCIDIGVRTHHLDKMLAFWTNDIGLPYNELLKLGNGVHQHRLELRGSVFKLNHARAPLSDVAPTGYRELLIAADITAQKTLIDPDGNSVTLVPAGTLGITHIGIKMVVRSLEATCHFFSHTLQADKLTATNFRWGTTVFLLEEDTSLPASGGMQGAGYRYVTVQVYKVDSEHAALLERGAGEAGAPVTLGSTARISFVTDPDGNWIEVSQRKSLTGDLSAS